MKLIPQIAVGSVVIALAFAYSDAQAQNNQVEIAKKQLAVGQKVKDFQLKSVGGELSGDVQLSKVNADGPVVVVVLRGYPGAQCPACTAQVGDFVKNAKKFAAKNARVLLVYPGSKSELGAHAEDFLQGTQLPAPLTFLLDPDFEFTNAYGLRWNAPRETAYPSTIVVDSSGQVAFLKISETHRGRATAEEILKAL